MVTQAHFLDRFRGELLNDDSPARWLQLADVRFYSALLGRIVTAPAGKETDLATVPRIPVAYWLVGGTCSRPAAIHDHLCRTGEVPRPVADAVFKEACTVTKVPAWRRHLAYAGTRIGGWLGIGAQEAAA